MEDGQTELLITSKTTVESIPRLVTRMLVDKGGAGLTEEMLELMPLVRELQI